MVRLVYVSGKRSAEIGALRWLEAQGLFTVLHVKIHLRSMIGLEVLRAVCRVFNGVLRAQCDFILLEGGGLSKVMVVLLGMAKGIPVGIRLKGDLWKEYGEIRLGLPLREKLARFINFWAWSYSLKHCDVVLPVSAHIARVAENHLKRVKKAAVVPIPYRRLSPDGVLDEVADELGSFVLTVTNFNFWAKVEPVLSAIKLCSPLLREHGIKWVILGDGFFLDHFRRQVEKHGDSDGISILGRKNPVEYYRRAIGLFYLSVTDGLPNVLLEALLYRLPVVVDKWSPVCELVRDGAGLVCDFRDRREVKSIVVSLLVSEERVSEYTQAGSAYVLSEFSPESVGIKLQNAICEVLNRGKLCAD